MAKDPAGLCEQGTPANSEVFVIPRPTWVERYAERATQPLHLNLLALFVQVFGTFSSKVAFDLVRPRKYAFATLEAARNARDLGKRKVTIIEFGVAAGGGLLGMCALARRVAEVTGVEIKVVGLDSGVGMPPPMDLRDHRICTRRVIFRWIRKRFARNFPPMLDCSSANLKIPFPAFLPS